jgi:hypothetical protein
MRQSFGFMIASATICLQQHAHPTTTCRSVLNTLHRVGPPSSYSTSIHHPRRSFGSIISSWSCASPTTPTLLFFGHFNMLFSLFSYYVMCFCCFLLNSICLGFRLFICEVVFFLSFFWFMFGNLYSSINMWHLNFHGLFESLFRCLFGICLELSIVVSIILRRNKDLSELHSLTIAIFTSFKEFIVFWIEFICLNF